MIEVWVDGSVRNGNPGLGGVAVVFYRNGKYVSDFSKIIGDYVTNNEVEYLAVITALEWLLENNTLNENCVIYTDSKIVYGQLVLGWKINFEHLLKLNSDVRNMCNKASFSVMFKHLKRGLNEEANELAQKTTLKEKERRGDARFRGSER